MTAAIIPFQRPDNTTPAEHRRVVAEALLLLRLSPSYGHADERTQLLINAALASAMKSVPT